jgi:hypothetical protein
MSYEEKGVWVFLTVSITGYVVYLALVLPQLLRGTPADEIDYVPAVLWTIGGAIVGAIVLRILVEIVVPSGNTRVGSAFLVIGALGALVLAMFEAGYFWIANVIYLGFVLSAILSSVTKVIVYRKGVPTW